VLAYLFNPLADRLDRLGLNRLLAALLIIGTFVVGFVALVLLAARSSRGSLPTSSTMCRSISDG
jgi:predicted PurR-regulated permease PerM